MPEKSVYHNSGRLLVKKQTKPRDNTNNRWDIDKFPKNFSAPFDFACLFTANFSIHNPTL
jgi:hypothetical protein